MDFETIKGLLAQQFKANPDAITMETRLVEDLKADSANVICMVMDLEDNYGIVIDDDQIMNLKTVGDVVKFIQANQ